MPRTYTLKFNWVCSKMMSIYMRNSKSDMVFVSSIMRGVTGEKWKSNTKIRRNIIIKKFMHKNNILTLHHIKEFQNSIVMKKRIRSYKSIKNHDKSYMGELKRNFININKNWSQLFNFLGGPIRFGIYSSKFSFYWGRCKFWSNPQLSYIFTNEWMKLMENW